MRCENILPHEKNNMPHRYIKKILSANVYDVAVETPVSAARSLSKRMDNNILFKREDLQPIYSFKIRGAYNCISQLSQAQQASGLVRLVETLYNSNQRRLFIRASAVWKDLARGQECWAESQKDSV